MLIESAVVYARHGGYWRAVDVRDSLDERQALYDALLLLERGREEHVAVIRHTYLVDSEGMAYGRATPIVEWTLAEVEMMHMVEDLIRICADFCAGEEAHHAAE